MTTQYENIAHAYVGELHRLLTTGHEAEPIMDPDSPASEFGQNPRNSIEFFGASFKISSLANTIVYSPRSRFNLTYGTGLLLWTLSGSDDAAFIEYYRGKKNRQKKAAFGKRLLNNRNYIDQVSAAIYRVTRDGGTRRAFMPIFDVTDGFESAGEIPCAIGFHLFLRSGKIHGVAIMRAENGLSSFPMDMFTFIGVLQYVSSRMGIEIGSYTHMSSTFHVFSEYREELIGLTKDPANVRMTTLGNHETISEDLERLLVHEREVRTMVERKDFDGLKQKVWLCAGEAPPANSMSGNLYRVILAIACTKLDNHKLAEQLEISNELCSLVF